MTKLLKLRPAIKEQWIAALTSGEYKQARGALNKPGVGMCCLGVLCDLHDHTADGLGWAGGVSAPSYGGGHGVPPDVVMHWAFENFDHSFDASVYLPGQLSRDTTSLAEQNDSGKSFNQIATIIQEVL